MGTCKDCKYWERQAPPAAGLFGACDSESIPNEPIVPIVFAGLGGNAMGVFAVLLTFEGFGCNQHEAMKGNEE